MASTPKGPADASEFDRLKAAKLDRLAQEAVDAQRLLAKAPQIPMLPANSWTNQGVATPLAVTLRIIWHNFLRAIWHIGATSYPTNHRAFRSASTALSYLSSLLISKIRRMSVCQIKVSVRVLHCLRQPRSGANYWKQLPIAIQSNGT